MGKTAGGRPLEANRRSSNDTVVQGYLQEVQKYQEMYYGFNRQYANGLAQLQTPRTSTSATGSARPWWPSATSGSSRGAFPLGPSGWWWSGPPCTGKRDNWERARRGEPLRPIPPLE
ncbi:PilA (plasmid) [Thermus thermophilus]|nr:PilA [Thermus thermophilus]BDB12591.1 hypothetical protein TthTMY_23300 [Thermus thermophilus]